MMNPWRFQFYLNEIKLSCPLIQVEFKHVGQSHNDVVDSLAKKEMDRPPLLFSLCSFLPTLFYNEFIPL